MLLTLIVLFSIDSKLTNYQNLKERSGILDTKENLLLMPNFWGERDVNVVLCWGVDTKYVAFLVIQSLGRGRRDSRPKI